MARDELRRGNRVIIPVPFETVLLMVQEGFYDAPRQITSDQLIADDHEVLEEFVKKTLRFLGSVNALLDPCPFCNGRPPDIILMGNPFICKHLRDCPLMDMIVNATAIMNPGRPVIVNNEFKHWDGPNFDGGDLPSGVG